MLNYLNNMSLAYIFQIHQYPSQGKNPFDFNLGSPDPKKLMNKENNSWKLGFMLSPPFQKTLNVLCINLVPLEHLQFPIHELFGLFIGRINHLRNVKQEFSSFN